MRRARLHPRWMMASRCCCCRRCRRCCRHRRSRCRRRGASISRHVDSNLTTGDDGRRPATTRTAQPWPPLQLPSAHACARQQILLAVRRLVDSPLRHQSKVSLFSFCRTNEVWWRWWKFSRPCQKVFAVGCRLREFCKCDVFGCPKSYGYSTNTITITFWATKHITLTKISQTTSNS